MPTNIPASTHLAPVSGCCIANINPGYNGGKYTVWDIISTAIHEGMTCNFIVTFSKKDFSKAYAWDDNNPVKFKQPPVNITVADGKFCCTDNAQNTIDLETAVANAAVINCAATEVDKKSIGTNVFKPRAWTYIYCVQVQL